MSIEIRNGRIVDPANGVDRVGIAVQSRTAGSRRSTRRLRAGRPTARSTPRGLVVAPGLVDLSARLREPGLEHKATLESEMQAAIAGGVTSLACPPDTDPPLDEPGLVEMLKHRARIAQPGARVSGRRADAAACRRAS